MPKRDLELEVYEAMCVGCPSEKRCHDTCDRCEDFMDVISEKAMEDLKGFLNKEVEVED